MPDEFEWYYKILTNRVYVRGIIGEVINMLSTHKVPLILADKNRKNIISPKELIKFA